MVRLTIDHIYWWDIAGHEGEYGWLVLNCSTEVLTGQNWVRALLHPENHPEFCRAETVNATPSNPCFCMCARKDVEPYIGRTLKVELIDDQNVVNCFRFATVPPLPGDVDDGTSPQTCPRGSWYNIHATGSCDVGYSKKYAWWTTTQWYCSCDAVPGGPVDEPDDVDPDIPPQTCPRGIFYTKSLLFPCDNGYVAYNPGLLEYEFCICTAKYEEGKAMIDGNQTPQNGDDFLAGNIMPIAIIGGGILAAIMLLRK